MDYVNAQHNTVFLFYIQVCLLAEIHIHVDVITVLELAGMLVAFPISCSVRDFSIFTYTYAFGLHTFFPQICASTVLDLSPDMICLFSYGFQSVIKRLFFPLLHFDASSV